MARANELVLTRRSQEVADLIALGLSNRDIARRLFLSERTVEWHVEQIFNRLGLTSRSQIAAWIARSQRDSSSRLPGASKRGNLPASLTSFVGRSRELTALKAFVGANRLVTLTGPGGVGKTRLAIRLAEDLVADYSDGAWLCDLAPLAEPTLIADALAQALGVRRADDEPLEAVKRYLKARHVLLILDNCEHLLEASSDAAASLLGACDGLRIVCTSRAPLGMLGEAVWRLDPLVEAEAVPLFIQRASAAAPNSGVEDASAESVAQICRLLDCIPLALELAAPKLRILSLDELATTVLDPASIGRREHRHSSLSSMADWSYRLLEPAEQELFCNLSIFTGWFDVEDAASVAPPGAAVAILLSNLAEQSLLVSGRSAEGATRFRILETLKAFAHARLTQSGRLEVVTLAHAERMVDLAERLDIRLEEGDTWLGPKVFAMVDDFRAALRALLKLNPRRAAWLAAVLRTMWVNNGRYREGMSWTKTAVEAHTAPTVERCYVLHVCIALLNESGNRTEAESLMPEATSLARLQECEPIRGELLITQSWIHSYAEDYAATEESLRQAIDVFTLRGEERKAAFALNHLAMAMLDQRRAAEARELAARATELLRPLSIRLWAPLDTLAEAHVLLGDYDEARRYWLEAVPLAMKEGNNFVVAGYIEGLALSAGGQGRKEEALRLYYCGDRLMADTDASSMAPHFPIYSEIRALVAQLERELGPEVASSLRAEGEKLSAEQALELASAAE